MNPSAPPGKSGKYGRPELERRFLLSSVPPGDVVRTAEITDRYLEGTRIRLRRSVEKTPVERGTSTSTYYKLTQKVPAHAGGPGLITTIYLNEDEWQRLAQVSERVLVLEKTRLSIPPFGVDVFAAPREGLVLAEVEVETEDELRAFTPPPWAGVIMEVTNDVRFTGGRLAAMSGDEIAALLTTTAR